MAGAAGAAVIGLAAAALALGTAASPPKQVVQVDRPWTCKSKVNLDLVRVTITRASIGVRSGEDAVRLRSGCTGRIGRLEVVQWAGDGVKVSYGVKNLDVGGGSIRCLGKAPTLHQDGIQVMGGSHITFHKLAIHCGRANARLINSELFINRAGKAAAPPTDVVCDSCSFGPWAAHTVSVQDSVRSGVIGSTLCVARFPQLTLAVGPHAVDAVDTSNVVRQCGPGRLVLDPGKRTTVFGRRLPLTGFFLGQLPGTKITALARTLPVASTTSGRSGRFRLVLRPRMTETVVVSGAGASAVARIGVQPKVVLVFHRRLVAKVFAARSYRGRKAILQMRRNGRWTGVQRVRLGLRSKTVIRPRVHGVAVRLKVPAANGYLPATSRPVQLP